MRVIKEINHPRCRISVFSWNDKYIIKFEKGHLEQSYKVSELDLLGDEHFSSILNESFINAVIERFDNMAADFNHAMNSY